MTELVPYTTLHQDGIDDMMREIIEEFSLSPSHPGYKPPLPDAYWVALNSGKVIGTIGMLEVGNYAVLKRMFLRKACRGKEKGISALMLHTAFAWSNEKRLKTIYLGTIPVFEAAQHFYRKHGFEPIAQSDLPDDFPNNPIDTLFYRKSL